MLNKNLEEKIYSMSNSFLPLDVFFNDIRDIKEKNYNKEMAYKDLEKIADFIIDLQSQLDQANEDKMWLNVEIDTLKSEKENLMRTLEEASEELECAIVPKFKIGQNVWSIINDKIGEANITKITAVEGSFREENTINYSITDSYGYALRLPEEQLFATLEEAEKKLQELRGEK